MREITEEFHGKTIRVTIECLDALTQDHAADLVTAYLNRMTVGLASFDRKTENWNGVVKMCAEVCKTYAHTDLKPSQMRRQVAYACERRILNLLDEP